MTVLTTSAKPAVADTAAALRPVPWRRMVWVTWRQHRPTLFGVPGVLGAVAIFLLFTGLWVHQNYTALITCHPASSDACYDLTRTFNNSDWTIGNVLMMLVNLVPALLGAFAGAPVLARELETGTFRYTWTQGIGRVRHTAARLVLLAIPVTVAAYGFSLVFAWFFGPFVSEQGMSVFNSTVFETRGISFAALTLVAFTIGAFLSMLIRKIIPAMAVTLGAYLVLALLTAEVLRKHYPVSGFWPMQFFEGGWLLVLSAALIAATVWLVRHRAA
jgi:ABC-type transport system involved in multi-copper enzyme maturation permease subunit